jgi:hypothetical protein
MRRLAGIETIVTGFTALSLSTSVFGIIRSSALNAGACWYGDEPVISSIWLLH